MKTEELKLHPLLEQILQGAKPNLDDFIQAFGGIFDLLMRLKDTPQDKIWHAEGDVYIHTQMVLEQTYKLLDQLDWEVEKRLVQVLAAVFHDIAKPIST